MPEEAQVVWAVPQVEVLVEKEETFMCNVLMAHHYLSIQCMEIEGILQSMERIASMIIFV